MPPFQSLWTPENIWLLLQHSSAYQKEFRSFETSARKRKDALSLKLLDAIRKGKFTEELLREQDYSQARWQRFIGLYSDVLRAPIDPEIEFNSTIACLILAA